jgi:SAM-dependent methyltransferase
MTAISSGTGPGVITPDGCAVEFYAMLRPGPEPEIIHRAAGERASSILELGAGTGRVTGGLTALGHCVVAVDESPEMLERITGAETVCAQIENLRLDRRFDVVLLCSYLLNVPDLALRAAFLDACARHVTDAGCVVIQHHPPGWFDDAAESQRESGGITMRLTGISRPGPGLLSARVEYEAGERAWTQSFTAMRVGEPELTAALNAAGLALDGYLTEDGEWIRAVPAAGARKR